MNLKSRKKNTNSILFFRVGLKAAIGVKYNNFIDGLGVWGRGLGGVDLGFFLRLGFYGKVGLGFTWVLTFSV